MLTCLECERTIGAEYTVLLFLGHTKTKFVEPEKSQIRLVLCDAHAVGGYAVNPDVFLSSRLDTLGFALVPGTARDHWYGKRRRASLGMSCAYQQAEYFTGEAAHVFLASFDRLTVFLRERADAFPEYHAGLERFTQSRVQIAVKNTAYASAQTALQFIR